MSDQTLFKLSSTEEFLDLSQESIKLYERIVIKDSIFDFFPFAEIYFKDVDGVIIQNGIFVEGLELKLQLGNDENGYLTHNYVWSESQINQTRQIGYLSGVNVLILVSSLVMKNFLKSKFFNDTISNIVKKIVKDDFGIVDYNNICNTESVEKWWQCNLSNSNFIQNLSERASSKDNFMSPIYTFINSKGNFYFTSLEKLFSQQSVGTYELFFGRDMSTNKNSIQKYNIMMGGLPLNQENYQKKIYFITQEGNYNHKSTEIEDYAVKHKKNKLLIRKQYKNIGGVNNFGIYEKEDKASLQGYINSLYRDSSLSYRMEIVIFENKDAVAGKIIDLKIKTSDKDGSINFSFSGKWLILESSHYVDENGVGYTNLLLGKSRIFVNEDHRFFNDFI